MSRVAPSPARAREVQRALLAASPQGRVEICDQGCPAAQGRGRALAAASRVLAGFPYPRSLAAERSQELQ